MLTVSGKAGRHGLGEGLILGAADGSTLRQRAFPGRRPLRHWATSRRSTRHGKAIRDLESGVRFGRGGTYSSAQRARWRRRPWPCGLQGSTWGGTIFKVLIVTSLMTFYIRITWPIYVRYEPKACLRGSKVKERVVTKPHPRARADLGQVYAQLMKDILKHRVLVASSDHPALEHTVSSPFELVPKMLPNRTLSTEARLVHDQRQVNGGTHKDLHPPAGQPTHEQVARRILWLKARYPGVPVVMAKKDVAGAFRLLWVDPRDTELFAGDVPWKPDLFGPGDALGRAEFDSNLTVIYLVSSFGFSGSPGEWTVWGRATEEVHRGLKPSESRRDGEVHFCGKILIDDMVLVEPAAILSRPFPTISPRYRVLHRRPHRGDHHPRHLGPPLTGHAPTVPGRPRTQKG